MHLYRDPTNQRNQTAKPPSSELEHWLKLVRRLPEVRVEKVSAVRHALLFRCYENEQLLDAAIMRLSRAMDASCR